MRPIPDELQDRLLRTAAEEFAARRFEGASLNRILERAGVSKGRFYYYFTDKAALFGAVLESLFSDLTAGIGRIAQAETPAQFWTAMHAMVEEGWRGYAEDPILKSLWHQALEMASQPGHPIQDFLQGLLDHMQETLAAGTRLGAVRRDTDQALLTNLLAAIDTAVGRWLVNRASPGKDPDVEELTRSYMDIYKRLLMPLPLLLEHLSESGNRADGEPSFQQGEPKRREPSRSARKKAHAHND